MDKTLEQCIRKVTAEKVKIVPYDPLWKEAFKNEAENLRKILPDSIVIRIEHFGSTAVPQISAKPIIDMLIEVTSLEKTKSRIVPLLVSRGYEYFWRPTFTGQTDYYAWFIKRGNDGNRSHHLHMVEANSIIWDALLFRDYLTEFPGEAHNYEKLKIFLSSQYTNDRIAYTKGKTNYIQKITQTAKQYYAMH